MRPKTIGIVGGMGPAAGLDVFEAITSHTPALRDQDHLNVWLASLPRDIPDRTAFLEGKISLNPAEPVAGVVAKLARAGANIIGMACNTVHVSTIFDELVARVEAAGADIQLVNMIDEVVTHVRGNPDDRRKIGVLGTRGTIKSDVYGSAFREQGYEPIYGDTELQDRVHAAIYDPDFGVKAKSGPASGQSVRIIESALDYLVAAGAEAIVLGCTELPLVIKAGSYAGVELVNPSLLLAKALVEKAAPGTWMENELA